MHIDHINIKAPPELLDEARQFYREVLGLEDGPRPRFSTRGHWLYSTAGPIAHLSESGGRAGPASSGRFNHVAFRTTGLEVNFTGERAP